MVNYAVELVCRSSNEYLTQVFTGFGELAAQKKIHLHLTKAPNYVPGVKAQPRLRAIIDETIRVVYDLRDIDEFYPDDLEWADIYFKRSYSPGMVASLGVRDKVLPYGFNYPVYGPHDRAFQRLIWSIGSLPRYHSNNDVKRIIDQALRSSRLLSQLTKRENCRANCSIEHFEGEPRYDLTPTINYFARLWDPKNVVDQYKDNCHAVNTMRLGCVKALRSAFGDRFCGGIQRSAYAMQVAADLVADTRMTEKKQYLKLTRRASICVTTLGVVGSNGWRIAELIAGAKAIVCEKLAYPVPGNFIAGQNYLEFTTPEECVQQVLTLLDNPDLCFTLMQNNQCYYQSHLRPDRLIWNTLEQVHTHAG